MAAVGTDIDAILCLNDDMAMGTQLAVEQAGKSDDIIVCGVNGIRMESMRSGTARLLPPYSRIPTARQRKRGGSFAVYSREKPESKIMIPSEL